MFRELNYDSFTEWPNSTSYNYSMDVILPPSIPSSILHFGYAVLDDKLIRSSFYVTQMMVDYQIYPQGVVIDPLAVHNGIAPSYYMGVTLDKKDINDFLISKKHPLETFVEKKNKRDHELRIYNSHMEGYFTQMAYEPGWFSDQLMEFAVDQGLHIPNSSHNNELRKSYEKAKERREKENLKK
jgi:hypothetical protein